ncbi:MAG: membrane dipeptidase [Lachnospiraceae bacterium]|nr:membrane dipeptidase [Lachnospiraceae bacterium]
MKIADMHCDTIERLLGIRRTGYSQHEKKEAKMQEDLRGNNGHLDLLRMKKSGYLLQNFALFVNLGTGRDPWEEVCALRQLFCEEMKKHSDLIAPVLSYQDIERNQREGKMSAMLTVEEGAVCKGELSKLHKLYEMGVRMMTLTWNYPNEIGFPNLDGRRGKEVWGLCCEIREKMESTQCEPMAGREDFRCRRKQVQAIFEDYFYKPNTTKGLTEQGFLFVNEMEKMGMIIDVSHLSDAGFYDVLECTTKPFVASHSNARAMCRASRNLSDDMIRKLAERGGVMGLNYCADFLKEVPVGERNPGNLEDMVRHAKYITDVGGIEVLGLGSDFDGIDTNEGLPGADSMYLLWEALKNGGYTESQLDKIFSENVLRVYAEIL